MEVMTRGKHMKRPQVIREKQIIKYLDYSFKTNHMPLIPGTG